jgi:SAM-dependent methyltransferase
MATTGQDRFDTWAQGDPYEVYVGRWSRAVARELLGSLRVPAGRTWLDVGCGTGALAQAILEQAAPAAVVGIDRSEGIVAGVRARVRDPRARFETGDAQALPVEGGAFDAVVSGLVLNFVPSPPRMLAEMARAARPGGTVALYVWDYAVGMELMRRFWDAAKAVDPAAAALDEGARFSVCAPAPLAALLQGVGLDEIATFAIDVPTVFRDFDDYWSPFLGGQGPAPAYVASLPEERREAIRERLRSSVPARPDGSIRLAARAWAATGKKRLRDGEPAPDGPTPRSSR